MTKLHLGCGPQALPGWVNIDNRRYPGVDKVRDVRKGLPYKDVSFVFAEHFIEHLAYDEALKLMRESRRVLRDDGVLRLSTPNLDWVWVTHYRLEAPDDQQVAACFYLNRAFRGWGHQFLYNERTLAATLRDAGFANVKRVAYGESEHPELRGLERHEKSTDYGELSHILIVEAWGRGGAAPEYLSGPREEFRRDVAVS
ncbi:MAG TPA: methyltransferase domain-containing protein [Thermoanaerobaculia bacterium]|nr:methyltransferase domain-containing protein [Thermoanaerobaculia bacterium]